MGDLLWSKATAWSCVLELQQPIIIVKFNVNILSKINITPSTIVLIIFMN